MVCFTLAFNTKDRFFTCWFTSVVPDSRLVNICVAKRQETDWLNRLHLFDSVTFCGYSEI